MPVVINDFEVVTEDQAQSKQSSPPAQESQVETTLGATPRDLEKILRHEKERLARVQAH